MANGNTHTSGTAKADDAVKRGSREIKDMGTRPTGQYPQRSPSGNGKRD